MPLVLEPVPSPPPQPEAPARPRPREIPWPDAFEPRPNYRKPEPRNWSWLLVIPLALMAALAFIVLDTHSLKLWIDINVLHREPIVASMDSPLLPAPFRPVPIDPGASIPAPVAEVAPDPLDSTPALPTSPVPVPPGTEVSPPPVDPTQAAVAAAAAPPIHVTIQYRRGIPGADGEARRLAALLQNTGGSVELHANAATVRAPMIMFYNAVDKHSAASLATVLANEVASWTVRQGTGKFPPGSIDIWMP